MLVCKFINYGSIILEAQDEPLEHLRVRKPLRHGFKYIEILTRCVCLGTHCFGHMPHERLIGKPLAFYLDQPTPLESGLSYIWVTNALFWLNLEGPKGVEGSTYHIIILYMGLKISNTRERMWLIFQTSAWSLLQIDKPRFSRNFVRIRFTLNGPSKFPLIVFSWIRNNLDKGGLLPCLIRQKRL